MCVIGSDNIFFQRKQAKSRAPVRIQTSIFINNTLQAVKLSARRFSVSRRVRLEIIYSLSLLRGSWRAARGQPKSDLCDAIEAG